MAEKSAKKHDGLYYVFRNNLAFFLVKKKHASKEHRHGHTNSHSLGHTNNTHSLNKLLPGKIFWFLFLNAEMNVKKLMILQIKFPL